MELSYKEKGKQGSYIFKKKEIKNLKPFLAFGAITKISLAVKYTGSQLSINGYG